MAIALETPGSTVTAAPVDLTSLAFQAADYAAQARSTATVAAYASDWAHFTAWTDQHHLEALPATPDTVVLYLTDLANQGRKPSTLTRRVASISHQHQAAKAENPTRAAEVRTLLAGIRRHVAATAAAQGERSMTRQATAIDLAKLARIVAAIDTTSLKGLRDRALLVVGFGGYFRRSELVGLTVEALEVTDQGIEAHLTRSKTDQNAAGTVRAMRKGHTDLDPVRALAEWLDAAEITTGPVFRSITRHDLVSDRALSTRSVAQILKDRAAAAGLDADTVSGHSLRRGAATTAHRNGADALTIARAGGWSDGSRTLHRYIENADPIAEAPNLGL